MYDASPDFNTANPFDAWWFYALAAGFQVCATLGRQVVDDARVAVGLAPNHTWDDALQAALIARVSQLTGEESAWNTVLDALRADQAARVVRAMSVAVALYLAYYRPSGRQFNAIQIPSGASLPAWGVALPAASDGSAGRPVCWDPAREASPWDASAARLAELRAASNTGIRIYDAGDAPVLPPVFGPTGDASTLWLGLAGVALVGMFVYAVVKP